MNPILSRSLFLQEVVNVSNQMNYQITCTKSNLYIIDTDLNTLVISSDGYIINNTPTIVIKNTGVSDLIVAVPNTWVQLSPIDLIIPANQTGVLSILTTSNIASGTLFGLAISGSD